MRERSRPFWRAPSSAAWLGEEDMDAIPIIHLPGAAPHLTVAGHPMLILSTAQHSRHACMFDWTVPPRFATGLHVHRVQEETFYVLDGACEWQVGEGRIEAFVEYYHYARAH